MLFSFAIVFFSLCTSLCTATPITGNWSHNVQKESRVDIHPVSFYAEKLPYSKGGMTVKFPENFFSSKPMVYVTVELSKSLYATQLPVFAVVEKCSNNAVTIRVNKEQEGIFFNSFAEAENGEFLINVFAFGS